MIVCLARTPRVYDSASPGRTASRQTVKEAVMADQELTTATQLPINFKISEVVAHPAPALHPLPIHPPAPAPSLGPLAAFTGTFHGNGFNTIFRPNNPTTPTPLPAGPAGGDNVLELNLTSE